ncbi:MAG: VOC family protein [Pseudomonadota bacterium]
MKRAFANILSDNVDETANFYQDLLGMTRHFDFGWFVILTHPQLPTLEFGILDRSNEIVPPECATPPGGVIVTFVVDDVDVCHGRAKGMQAQILEPPTDMPYGQRRMLIRDPEGTVVDVSSPTASAV